MKKIDKVIKYFRHLNEESMVVGNGENSLGFNLKTETPPVYPSKKKKRWIYVQKLRSWWNKNTKENKY
jgi:hypothetical protein